MNDKVQVILGGSEGNMGETIYRMAQEIGDIDINTRIDPKQVGAMIDGCYRDLDSFLERIHRLKIDFKEYSSYVDFTQPDVVVDNVRKVSEVGIDSIIGTTGWYDQMGEVKEIAEDNGVRILPAPNFSIGVNALFHITEQTAKLLGTRGYDGTVFDLHHTDKKDSPSGTAENLGNILKDNIPGKDKLTYERRIKREDNEIDVLGGRMGSVVGHHRVYFAPKSGYFERLILEHDAFNRDVFGAGVLEAMRWMDRNKDKEPGLYTFKEDVLGLKS